VLDLDGYQDAVDQLCRCDQQLGFLPACSDVLVARLAEASPAIRSKWLDYYAGHCASGCEHAYACFSQTPTCTARGLSCRNPLECCSQENDAGAGECLGLPGERACY